ncbi:MAG: hypothetical protein ACMUHU_07345, partial [Thermoplasmatota archaeon]
RRDDRGLLVGVGVGAEQFRKCLDELIVIGVVLVVLIAVFIIISFPIFHIVTFLGLPGEVSLVLTLIVMECLVIVPITILMMRRYLKKEREREEQRALRALDEERKRREEAEPVDFMEWFGSWDYSDNEEHLKSMSAMRRTSVVSTTTGPETPEDYYMKRWGVDRF